MKCCFIFHVFMLKKYNKDKTESLSDIPLLSKLCTDLKALEGLKQYEVHILEEDLDVALLL